MHTCGINIHVYMGHIYTCILGYIHVCMGCIYTCIHEAYIYMYTWGVYIHVYMARIYTCIHRVYIYMYIWSVYIHVNMGIYMYITYICCDRCWTGFPCGC